ncbi:MULTISPECIES: hypothetical protein [Micrococcaceae]|uniref:hypothetical protein n=1 Tax=Micrococcaceae TaxID=1268 RepID=UPI001CFF7BD3|nr:MULTISPECIES: hypothetical protein [Micrococcaceae]MDJ0353580.1 hypothetical protein [Pseudarthrobacter sp. PH31-O2]WGZ79029.1 hypothetical protein QI450_14390 [Arthrobacter sp. EM1]
MIAMLCCALVGLSTPTAASAASFAEAGEPSAGQQAIAMDNLREHIAADPTDFQERMNILDDAPAIDTYLERFDNVDVDQQKAFFAASMPTEALRSFVDMTNKGALDIRVTSMSDGTLATSVEIDPTYGFTAPAKNQGETTALPSCPSAWAAFWAWYATEAAFCGAMGFFGPGAALACALAMGLGGTALDFNRGC